jgi:hypothetical protein
MEVKTVKITYDTRLNKWYAENPVTIYHGLSLIIWAVTLSEGSTGAIKFGTEPDFPGIQFTDGWPGTPPKGDGRVWYTEIADKQDPGTQNQLYHYTVNTWYQSDDRAQPAVKKSWDPDVEEGGDPPPVKK